MTLCTAIVLMSIYLRLHYLYEYCNYSITLPKHQPADPADPDNAKLVAQPIPRTKKRDATRWPNPRCERHAQVLQSCWRHKKQTRKITKEECHARTHSQNIPVLRNSYTPCLAKGVRFGSPTTSNANKHIDHVQGRSTGRQNNVLTSCCLGQTR